MINVANTVIDSKTVNCDLSIQTTGVVIRNSRINGQVNTEELTTFSYSLTDTEVNAGSADGAAIGTTGITLLRVNVHGGATSVYCWAHCDIRDSWLHGQYLAPGSPAHLGGFLANDNSGVPHPTNDTGHTDAVLVHNSIWCDTLPNAADGGCSGDINLYGDFGTIRYVTVDNNLIGASPGISYCIYGGNSSGKPYPSADHVVITNNVIQRGSTGRCGNYGPVAGFNSAGVGSVWSGNVWDSGEVVPPEN